MAIDIWWGGLWAVYLWDTLIAGWGWWGWDILPKKIVLSDVWDSNYWHRHWTCAQINIWDYIVYPFYWTGYSCCSKRIWWAVCCGNCLYYFCTYRVSGWRDDSWHCIQIGITSNQDLYASYICCGNRKYVKYNFSTCCLVLQSTAPTLSCCITVPWWCCYCSGTRYSDYLSDNKSRFFLCYPSTCSNSYYRWVVRD